LEPLALAAISSDVITREEALPLRTRLPLGLWPLFVYLAAITIIGKGPTYIGIPPVYWGEVVLALTLLWCLGRYGLYRFLWSGSLTLTCFIIAFACLGVVLTLPGYSKWGVTAIRDGAIWYYGALFFIGAALGKDREVGSAFWLKIRWFWPSAVVWFIVAYVVVSEPAKIIPVIIKTRGVPLFSSSGAELVMHCGLAAILLSLSLRPYLLGTKSLVVLLSFAGVMIVALSRGRGAKLAVLAAFLSVALVLLQQRSRFINRLLFAATLMLLIAGIFVTVLALDRPVTKVTYVDRFSPEELGRSTGAWRTTWWTSLYNRVNRESPLLGLGFGQSLSIYSPFLRSAEKDPWPVRSPHNVNLTVFARMGYVGAALWLCILILGIVGFWYRLLQSRARKIPSHALAEAVFWASLLTAVWVNSTFGVLMEGPVLGFWFWFAMGFGHSRLSLFLRESENCQHPEFRLAGVCQK
jgi:hypothetical protein